MKKSIGLLIATCCFFIVNAQVHINREFQESSGSPVFNPVLNPFGLQWSKTISSIYGGVIVVAHVANFSQGENTFLKRVDDDGNVVFAKEYNTGGTNNDYGIDVYEDPGNGHIYLCGTTDNGVSNDYDGILLHYSNLGVLLDSAMYVGTSGLNDIITAIGKNPITGKINVAISNENTTSSYDYVTAIYSSSLIYGAESSPYDYASSGLPDVPIGIDFDASGNILLVGASASSALDWDYTSVLYDVSTLGYITDDRVNVPGIGYDQPAAFCKNAAGDIFITGRASTDGINYDIRTVKISSSLSSIIWNEVYDGIAGLEDGGSSITLDNNGDIIIGGFTTNSAGKKEMIWRKYDGSTGSPIWTNFQSAEDPNGDAFVKTISLDQNNNAIYFVAGEKGTIGYNQTLVGKIKNDGTKNWQKVISDPSADVLPSNLQVAPDGIYAISVLDASINSYQTTMYKELELDTNIIYSNTSKPICKYNELIVKFLPSALDSAAIDNQVGTAIRDFADLSDFMEPSAYTQVTLALEPVCRGRCDIKAIKIFPGLPTTYTSSISRLGETVPIGDFWATLLLKFPLSLSIQQVYDLLNTIPNVVAYSHPNFIATIPTAVSSTVSATTSGTLDPVYPDQASLHTTTVYPNAHINMEDAWRIFPDAGYPHIRVGVFDSGLDWSHADFGTSTINQFGSLNKVKGWDFQTSQNMRNLPYGGDSTSHGTADAGIIGAIRNNTIAIKGIAGGNDSLNGNRGVTLYGLKIFKYDPFSATLNYIADAIVSTALYNNNPNIIYDYGLHLQNHSWGLPENVLPWYTDSNVVLLTEAIHQANRLNVTLVASRGNLGINNIQYPAVADDDWVISVGGFNSSGNWDNTLNWGRNVDITAPSDLVTIWSTAPLWYSPDGLTHHALSSAAAAHVSGVGCLLQSYLNDTLVPYNNLAPEDVEQIIQRSASPMLNGAALPNDSVGYGRLDAGKALRMVEKPCNKLWHFGTKSGHCSSSTITKNLNSVSDTVVFTERCRDLNYPSTNWLPKGKFVVNTFRIDAFVDHNLPGTDTIRAYWPRPSYSDVWELHRNKKLRPRERDTILSCNNTQAHLRGYIYEVNDTLGNFKGWWPCDTTFSCSDIRSLFEYSILTKSCVITSIKEKALEGKNVLSLYPNPTKGGQTLIIQTDKVKTMTIDLFDISGRLVKCVYSGKTNADETVIQVNVNNLPNSLYIYVIKLDDKIISKKFIKE